MDESPKTLVPYGCTVFIFLSFMIGFVALIYLFGEEHNTNREIDWWLLGLFGITSIYMIVNYRYFIPFRQGDDLLSVDWFSIGRMLCFLSFPAFAYLITAIIWYLIDDSRIAVTIGLVTSWLISKLLQRTVFAYEYINRDRY